MQSPLKFNSWGSSPIYATPTLSNLESLSFEGPPVCDSIIDGSGDAIPIASDRENREAMAFKLDAVARGVIVVGAAVFVSTALLTLAKRAAGCNDEQPECEGRVYGMRPSSVLTNIVMVVGLITAVCLPLVGSIIDHSQHRRFVGRITAAALVVLIMAQISILSTAWAVAAILQIFIASTYMIHLCTSYAYLPELTSHKKSLVTYTAQFVAAQYAASVTFLIFMVGILSVVDIEAGQEMLSSRISQSVVVLVATFAFGYAWTYLFRDRPASHAIPEGCTLFTAGFRKIFKTSRIILAHHNAIKWFLVSVALTEGALTAFSSIAITYMTDQLLFTSRENGIAILLLQISAVPGTQIAAMITNRYNPIRSLQACLVLWVLSTGCAAWLLRGGGQQHLAYVFAVLWGFSSGWVYPTEKVLYCTIIPKGQEAEFMGIYICACQILSWLPPLMFSVMNEAGISMRIGLFSLNIFFFLSFCILFLVGDYNKAAAHAEVINCSASLENMNAFVPEHEDKMQHGYNKYVEESDIIPEQKNIGSLIS